MEKGYTLSLSVLFAIIVILTGVLTAWLLRPVDNFNINDVKVSINSDEPTAEMFGAPTNKVIYYKDGKEVNYDDLSVGTYDVKVIVNNKEYKSKIYVYDDEKPVLKLNDITVKYGEKYSLDMFISSCDDNSNLECNYKISDEKMLEFTEAGSYTVEIIASDNSGNVSSESAKLTILPKEVEEKPSANSNVNTSNPSTSSQPNNTNQNTNNSKPATSTPPPSTNTKPSTSTPSVTPSSGVSTSQSIINEVLRNVNSYRSEVGASALTLDSRLNEAARIRVGELAQLNSVSHTRPDGRSCFTVLSDLGINYGGAAENVAKGQNSASAVSASWRNSSGHYQNIINKNFTKVGISYVVSNNTYFWVMLFI